MVVGPSGVFVVTHPEPDLESSARRVLARADDVRVRLEKELDWVPFVDAVIASPRLEDRGSLPCLAVPVNELPGLVTEGPQIITDEVLARLLDLRLTRARATS